MSGHCPACVCDALPPPEVGQAYLGGLIAAALVGADVVKKTLCAEHLRLFNLGLDHLRVLREELARRST